MLASVLMVASALVLFFTIKENKLEEELRDEMARGEEMAAIEEKIVDDDQPLSKANRRMLFLIHATYQFFCDCQSIQRGICFLTAIN